MNKIQDVFSDEWNAKQLGITIEEMKRRKIWAMDYANKHALDWMRPDFFENTYIDYLRGETNEKT